jgi:hypothetical protein
VFPLLTAVSSLLNRLGYPAVLKPSFFGNQTSRALAVPLSDGKLFVVTCGESPRLFTFLCDADACISQVSAASGHTSTVRALASAKFQVGRVCFAFFHFPYS